LGINNEGNHIGYIILIFCHYHFKNIYFPFFKDFFIYDFNSIEFNPRKMKNVYL